ncbi:carboxypeptidase regulatory-like domain-containing protein [candidate division TA06 bacterium]|uniref:Carboxypeptidase regulatory-like domain-containing protein n=1 Tax=candidate division TA06 bacterium TaxID=2250710 RepID=A0A523UPW4_UNCT6|nr:MAG: carboxypeptidase regulatory-like domain-containing protein [candidate division TA06 bacterium]
MNKFVIGFMDRRTGTTRVQYLQQKSEYCLTVEQFRCSFILESCPQGVKLRRTGLAVLLLFFICSCRAERFNPLDPESPRFKDEWVVAGTVRDWNSGYIEGVRIELKPGLMSGVTDGTGEYEIKKVPRGSYTAVASKEFCSAETIQVEVVPGSPTIVDFKLDRLPVFSQIRATTHDDSISTGNDLYAIFSAKVLDPDGWVLSDSVFLSLDTSMVWPMRDLGSDSFGLTLPDDSLPGNNLEYLIGRDLVLLATDNAGRRSISDSFGITRIIYDIPVALSPIIYAPQNPVTFKWSGIDVEFEFTYTLTVEQINPPENKIWVVEGISSNSTNYPLKDTLTLGGTFLWCMKALDSFDNSSRSRFELFTVD